MGRQERPPNALPQSARALRHERMFAPIADRFVLVDTQGPGKVVTGARLEMIGGDAPLLVGAGRA
jgi:hypothetical protein